MAIRTVNSCCGNNAGLVEHFIGTAYDVVKTVYDNLGTLTYIYDFLNQHGVLVTVDSVDELKALNPDMKYARVYTYSLSAGYAYTDYLYVATDTSGIIPNDSDATGSWVVVPSYSTGENGGTSYIPYVYAQGSALGGETTIAVPNGTVGVPFIIIEGLMNTVGYGFTYDAATLTVTLTKPLETGDEVVLLLTGTPAVPDNPNISNWVQFNWLYSGGYAVGGEQVIAIPYTFEAIPAIYKNGLRYAAGLAAESYTVDAANQRILLTEPLATNDRLIVQIGGETTTITLSDRTIQEIARATNVRDDEVILSTDSTHYLNGKKIIYDVVAQRYWKVPELPTNVYINKVEGNELTYSPGNITVPLLDGEADVRELWRRNLLEAGLTLVDGSFEDGAVVNTSTDAVWYKAQAQCYIWKGTLPKTVIKGSTPDSTGGVSPTGWVSAEQFTIISELANPSSQLVIAGETVSDVGLATKTAKMLSQFAHVHSYAGDNAKLIGILEKENCSLEGGQLDINDSFDFTGNKRIRVNEDTIINVTGSVDHVLKFMGHVKWDGLGRLTINVNHNDKADRSQSALCFPNAIPTLDNIDIIGANGTSVLVGLPYFGSGAPMNGQGSGKISNVRTFDCGKGVHVYGNANKDTTIVTENLQTDNMTGYLNGQGVGGGGNTFYLSYHRHAKNIGGYFEHHPDSFGSNINRSLFGEYQGGFFQGADGALSRGPTFGEDLQFGSIYGGGVSRNCGFSAISADIRKGDGSYPVSRVLIDGWHAIGCGRTLYSQAQDLSFGNIHTKESKAADFLFRINGASPKAVKQIGVITAFDCVNTPVFVWCDTATRLYLRPELTIHDGTVSTNIPFVADNPSGATDSIIFEGTNYSTVTADYVVPNGQRRIEVNLASAGAVTTLRLPAARYSNIKNSRYEIFVRGGNGTKILRLLVNNGDGTINGATTAVDITPATGAVVKRDILSLGAGAYLVTT